MSPIFPKQLSMQQAISSFSTGEYRCTYDSIIPQSMLINTKKDVITDILLCIYRHQLLTIG